MDLFDGKILMITGGTGSFGNAVLKRFLKSGIGEIRIFSRMRKSRMTCAICTMIRKSSSTSVT